LGDVHLVQDTRLDRKVALKILPTGVAANQVYFGYEAYDELGSSGY